MDEDLLELKSIIGDQLFQEVSKHFSGSRIYFPSSTGREEIYARIRDAYSDMKRSGILNETAIVKLLAKHYNYSTRQIIRICKGL